MGSLRRAIARWPGATVVTAFVLTLLSIMTRDVGARARRIPAGGLVAMLALALLVAVGVLAPLAPTTTTVAAQSGGDEADDEGIVVSGRLLGWMDLEPRSSFDAPRSVDGVDRDVYATGQQSEGGLWSDGVTMWVAENHSDGAWVPELDEPVSQPYLAPNIAAPNSGSSNYFVAEDKERNPYRHRHEGLPSLYAYHLDTGLRDRASELLNSSEAVYDSYEGNLGGGGALDGIVEARGVWSDGEVLWVSDGTRAVKAFDLASLRRRPDLATQPGADRRSGEAQLLTGRSMVLARRVVAGGLWSDGVTMWVADTRGSSPGRSNKLVAFDLATGARLGGSSGRDVVGLVGAPRAMWSDGSTWWVAERSSPGADHDVVRAYRFDPDGGTAVRDPSRDLPLAVGQATGLWSNGKQMWVGDGHSRVYVYCLDAAASCHDPDSEDAGDLWPSCAHDGRCNVDASGWTSTRANLARRYSAADVDLGAEGNGDARGVWSGGDYLWVADAGDDKLYVHALTDSVTSSSLSLASANGAATGIWSDDRGTAPLMWVADEVADKLFAYTIDPYDRSANEDITLADDNDHPAGLWSDGTTIWVVDQNDTKLYAYAYDATHTSAKDMELDPANSAPWGIWSDGDTVWVTDTSDGMLYAYELASGRRLPSRDAHSLNVFSGRFSQPQGNTSPRGIWFEPAADGLEAGGAVVYVADSADNLAYGYRAVPALFSGVDAGTDFAPRGLTAEYTASGTLTVRWEAARSGQDPTGYVVRWRRNDTGDGTPGPWTESPEQPLTARSYVITGIADHVEWDIEVRAVANDTTSMPITALTSHADGRAPIPADARIADNGNTVLIAFTGTLVTTSVPAPDAFTVTADDEDQDAPTAVAFTADDPPRVSLSMRSPIPGGEAVTVAYTQPDNNPLLDDGGDAVRTFTGHQVLNRPGAPAGPTLSAASERLVAEWTAPADGGSLVTGYQIAYKTTTAADTAYQTVDRDDPTTRTETITGLTNSVDYDVRVRAVNAVGAGPWSEPSALAPDPPPQFERARAVYFTRDGVPQTDVAVQLSEILSVDVNEAVLAVPQVFSVTVGSQTYTPVSAIANTDITRLGNWVSLSFVPALPGGQAMTVSYSPDPAADAPVFDLTGDAAPPFADRPVTNYPAAPAVTLSPGDTALTASWTAPLDGGAAINRYQADWRRSGTTDTWTLSDYLDASQPRTYQITGLTNDVSYDVRVRALNTPAPSDFGGPWSAVATATPVEADTTAPTVTSSSVDGPRTVTLNFSEQLDTASVPAASAFEVTLNSGTPFSPTSVAIPSANSSAVELGLPSSGRIDPGDTVSVSYTEPSSNPLQDNPLPVSNAVADFTHTVANVPDAPAAPTAVGRNMSVALSWDTTGIADGGSPITRYEIQHKEASADDSAYGAATAVDAGSLTVVEHTIAGLTNGTSYDVRLRAVNEHGQSAWSPAATVTPDPLPAPVAALASGTGLGFVVDFSEPLDATKHPPETAFTVSVDGAAVTPNGVFVSGDTVLLTVDDPFAAGADVTVAYTADPSAPIADLVGDTAASFPDLLVKNRPAAPTLTLVPADDRLGASWAEPRTGGSPITGYRMQIKRASQPDSAYASSITGSAGSELHLAADTRSTVFTGLANGTAYDVRIHARNVVAGSPWATGQSTPAERDLIAPALRSDNPIIIIEADPDTVTIFYNEPLDTASVPAAAAFAVTVGSAAATAPDSVLIPADDPDTAGLDESSTVVLVMSADIGAGETVTVAYTAPADNPIRDLAAADNITAGFDSAANTAAGYTAKTATNRPAAPAAPTLTVGDTSLTVAVAAPAADGGSPITGYEVQHKASSAADSVYDSNPTTSVSAGAVNAVIRGLTNGTDYDVRVRAVNAAGPGPWSDAATQAPDTLIAAPASAWAFPGDELVLVRWTPPEGIRDDANLLGYEIQHKSGTQTYSDTERRVVIDKTRQRRQPASTNDHQRIAHQRHGVHLPGAPASHRTALACGATTSPQPPSDSGPPDSSVVDQRGRYLCIPSGSSVSSTTPATRELAGRVREHR